MTSLKAISALCLLATCCLPLETVHAAGKNPDIGSALEEIRLGGEADYQEPDYAGWSLNVDNDLFSGGDRDRDYTGGIAIAVTGARTRDWLFSLDNARATLTRLGGFESFYKNEPQLSVHSIEFGFALFTPSDISIAEPIRDDHPYASLFFVANTAQYILPERKTSYQSVLTIGVLGLPLAESIQGGIHSAINGVQPEGWDNQISAGGELTARYSIGIQKTLIEGGGPGLSTQFSVNSEANLGFTTDANVGFGVRWGRLERPWHTFNPHTAEYISIGSPPPNNNAGSGRRETYLYAGANLKYRFYNAILQGQFRDSEVAFDFEQLNPVIAEAWAGLLTEVFSGYRFGMFIRGRSAEIDKSQARNPVWGGFLISRSL